MRRRAREIVVVGASIRLACVLAVALASAACTGDRDRPDADAATDIVPFVDGDARFDLDGAADVSAVDATIPRWECPPEWVPALRGGCGPAVILCADGGDGVPSACESAHIDRPHAVAAADGGTGGSSFYRFADGGIGGGWSAPSSSPTSDGGVACPPGWSNDGDVACAPSLRTDCPVGTGPLPDGRCTATGESDCPSTRFADPGPAAMGAVVVHVASDADAASADGSETYPYASLTAALARVPADGWMLVAAGTYPEGLLIDRNVHVLGTCAAHTTIASASSSTLSLHATAGAHVDVAGLSVAGAGGAFLIDAGAQATLRDIHIAGATGIGIQVTGPGSRAELLDVFVTGTRFVVDGSPGVGIRVLAGATLMATDVSNTSNHGGIVVREAGSTATIANVLLRDSLPRYDGMQATALGAFGGASVHARYAVIDASLGFGLVADAAGSRIDMADSHVRGSLPLSDLAPGTGVQARAGGSITLTRVLVAHNRASGVSSVGADTRVDLVDSAVIDTLPTLAGIGGRGIDVGSGGTLRAERALVSDATEVGVFASGGRLELVDAMIHATHPSVQGFGIGLGAGSGAQVDAQRVAITESGGAGIAATSFGAAIPPVGSMVRIDDLYLARVRESTVEFSSLDGPAPSGPPVAYGVSCSGASTAAFQRAVIADGGIGLYDRNSTLSRDTALITGQRIGSAAPNAAVGSQAMLRAVTFFHNGTDGPVIDPTLPEPFATP